MQALKIEYPSHLKSVPLQDQKTILQKRILTAAKDGRLRCPNAMAIAGSLGIKSHEVSEAANELNIKISSCQLGCF